MRLRDIFFLHHIDYEGREKVGKMWSMGKPVCRFEAAL